MNFNTELKRSEIQVGSQLIQVECIADLNKTIDEWFAAFGDEPRTEAETQRLENLCPYFGVIWASARALCQALADLETDLTEKDVLEVGCGLALPSLYCAKIGARVTATDFHPAVPRFLERNLALNGVQKLRFVLEDWKSDHSPLGRYDWVIGSDILYEREHAGPVARALARHCKPDGRIILADPARPYLQGFSDEMKNLGFREETRILTVPDDPQPKDVFVLNYSRP
jgi:predicted nicotinamide N-methyase